MSERGLSSSLLRLPEPTCQRGLLHRPRPLRPRAHFEILVERWVRFLAARNRRVVHLRPVSSMCIARLAHFVYVKGGLYCQPKCSVSLISTSVSPFFLPRRQPQALNRENKSYDAHVICCTCHGALICCSRQFFVSQSSSVLFLLFSFATDVADISVVYCCVLALLLF